MGRDVLDVEDASLEAEFGDDVEVGVFPGAAEFAAEDVEVVEFPDGVECVFVGVVGGDSDA